MTKRALAKLTDNQKDTLDTYYNYYMRSKENENMIDKTAWKNKIFGYLEALMSVSQITDRERMVLRIYFTR